MDNERKILVDVLHLEAGDERFCFFKEIEVPRVPVAGDKIFIEDKKDDGEKVTYAYNVVDVHLGDDGSVDVCVVNIGEMNAYLTRLASMHR
jgi:hypothetical protein